MYFHSSSLNKYLKQTFFSAYIRKSSDLSSFYRRCPKSLYTSFCNYNTLNSCHQKAWVSHECCHCHHSELFINSPNSFLSHMFNSARTKVVAKVGRCLTFGPMVIKSLNQYSCGLVQCFKGYLKSLVLQAIHFFTLEDVEIQENTRGRNLIWFTKASQKQLLELLCLKIIIIIKLTTKFIQFNNCKNAIKSQESSRKLSRKSRKLLHAILKVKQHVITSLFLSSNNKYF